MPTYRNKTNKIQYVSGMFVPPGETVATEEIIVSDGFEKISDNPVWSPLKFSQSFSLTAGQTQAIDIPTPEKNMYVSITKNTCGLNIYNATSGMIASLFPDQLIVFNTHGKVEQLTLEAWADGDVAVQISTEEVQIV